MGNSILFTIVLVSLIACNSGALQIDQKIQNKNVERNIDLTTQLVKIQYKITLENEGKGEFSGVSYIFVLPTEERERLSYISIRDALKKELKPTEEKITEGSAFIVTLTSSSPTPVLNIETVFTKSLEPYPTQITQSERQFVRYFGNAYFYTPYKTITQKTTVQLATKSVESYTAVKPSTQSDSTITYGSYENIAGLFIFFFIYFFDVLRCKQTNKLSRLMPAV